MHGELTGRIRQTAFEVHRYFRYGFLEKVYENALAHRLRKQGLRVEQQKAIAVKDEDGTEVGEYYADLLIEGFLIVEIKATRSIAPEHVSQLLNYLRATGGELGILVNFGACRMEFRRFLWTEERVCGPSLGMGMEEKRRSAPSVPSVAP